MVKVTVHADKLAEADRLENWVTAIPLGSSGAIEATVTDLCAVDKQCEFERHSEFFYE